MAFQNASCHHVEVQSDAYDELLTCASAPVTGTSEAWLYRPGELLKRYAHAADEKSDTTFMPENDTGSECSTADTLTLHRSAPVSPPPGLCEPQGQEFSQQISKHPIELDELLRGLELGSQDLPSAGSAGHKLKACKPCGFFHTRGCEDGAACNFCHLCPPGTIEQQRKEKRRLVRALKFKQHLQVHEPGSDCSVSEAVFDRSMTISPPPGLCENEGEDHEQGVFKPTLELNELLSISDVASVGLPSAGSSGHASGACKPCGFLHTRGCSDGAACQFCHLCPPGTIEQQRKEKRRLVRALQRKQRLQADAMDGCSA